jgi:hypothetical protein
MSNFLINPFWERSPAGDTLPGVVEAYPTGGGGAERWGAAAWDAAFSNR